MTREETIDILCALNEWRRYDGPIGEGPIMPNPREIGEAIDAAVAILQSKEIPYMAQPGDTDPDRFTTKIPYTNKLIDEGLSVRARNRLKVVDIKTVGDLCGWTRGGIMKIRNCGKKTFRELEGILVKYGLTWGMWESPSYLEWGIPKLD